MTAEEDFEEWWDSHKEFGDDTLIDKNYSCECYLAATKATAQRCMDICTAQSWRGTMSQLTAAEDAIKKEFVL
jgi:hypothetical protein